MSLVPTSQCITDCSILNQSTCAPASPRPRTIVNYHMVSVHDLEVIMVVMNYLNNFILQKFCPYKKMTNQRYVTIFNYQGVYHLVIMVLAISVIIVGLGLW